MQNKKLSTLINKFIAEEKIENGLTLPFIVGSFLLIENREYNSNTINECIDFFFDNDKYFNLQFCEKIKELIVSNLYFDDEKVYLSNLKIKKIKNIISTDNSLELFNTEQDLCNEIFRLYNDDLKKGHFSKLDGKWRSFKKSEIKLIEK